MTSGQDKQKAKETPIATPTPAVPLTLTDAETKEGIKLQGELDAANAAFEAVMEKAVGQTADADLLLSIWKAKSLYANARGVRARATQWFADAQKAHNCEGCTLEKGVFIKPEVKK